MLLDCFTIPTVMVLSSIFLDAKYGREHIVGVFLCLFGISILVLSDVLNSKEAASNHNWNYDALLGDILCLCGAAIYGCSNVAQEFLVKKNDRVSEISHRFDASRSTQRSASFSEC